MVTTVIKGKVTYDAEGNDVKNSPYYSRVIHWPGNDLSGVTIGRGYDMGNRIEANVLTDLTKAGITLEKAKKLSKGAQLKGDKAKEFVKLNKDKIEEIEITSQINLFNGIYPTYEALGKKNYEKWTTDNSDRVAWDKLDKAIQVILIDFVYQGFTRGPRPMVAGMTNDFDTLINYIKNTPAISRYEAGRNRAKYLEDNRPKAKPATIKVP